MVALEILLWIGLFSIFYTYLFYPLLLKFFARNKSLNYSLIAPDKLPKISIVMAAYNEEKVIEQKIRSVFNGNYPANLIEFYVGSDNSLDQTNAILTRLAKEYPQLNITLFTERQGKINILNQFIPQTSNEIIISTDANNIFFKDTLQELVSTLCSNDNIGLVDALILHNNLLKSGMSLQEHSYINGEANKKYNESILFGIMMSPFGGCYAFRKHLWSPIPTNFLVDDLFVHISVIKQNYKALFNPKIKTQEDISNNPAVEFRRKIRIAAGSFQNFFLHFKTFANPFTKVGFVMLSHKVLRWFGPPILLFILIATIILNVMPNHSHIVYNSLLLLEIASVIICLMDILLRRFNIHLSKIRHLTHFYTTNLAVLCGLLRYIRGVKSSVWVPTQRHQK